MSAAQQKVIDDHCTTDWAARVADPWADFEQPASTSSRPSPGHEVYPITDEQLKEWKASAEPLRGRSGPTRCKKAGGDPDAVLKELKAALAQYKAGY